MQVYLLDIYFSFDNDYRSRSIGCFSTLELAQFHKSKWELFFTTKIKEIINPTLSNEEEMDFDYDEVEQIYPELAHYQEIRIIPIELDVDLMKSSTLEYYSKVGKSANTETKDLMRQWDRDYKIGSIL